MAKLGINTGSAPDAGDGDNLQQGAIKINSNFDEVYTLLGNGTALAPGIVTSIVGGNNIAVSTSVGQVTLNVTGNTWDDNTTGIHTLSNVGIGTTNATDELKVSGTVKTDQIVVVGVSTFLNDVNFNFDLTIGEDASLERNLKVTGVSTFVGESNFNDSVLITGITTCNSLIDANGDLDVDGHTELDNLRVSGVATFASNVYTGQITATSLSLSSGGISAAGNSGNLNWGSGNLYFNSGSPEIGWTSGNGTIRSLGAGSTIFIKGGNPGENMGVFRANGASELYYNNAKKIETTNTGVTVTGAVNATSFVGDGSGLTGINATGAGVSISDGGSFIGVASAINFGSNLSVSSISAGIVTVTGQAGGGSTADVRTNSLVVSGVSTFTDSTTFGSHVSLGNGDEIRLGSSNQMKMYYSSAGDVGAFVQSLNNDLHLVGSTSGGVRIITYNKDSLVANYNGSVDLYHNGSKKFETTNTGVTVAGALNATSFVGDGSGLSGVNATGTGVSAFNSGTFVGVASAINFADNLTLSTISAGLVTVTAGAATTANVVTNSLVVSGVSTISGNIIVGHNPSVQGTGSILKAHQLNLTGPDSSDSNSSYYSNIRANKVGSGFKYDLEFHSNGYSSGDIGDFIFYRRGTSFQRYERMRLSGETGKLTVTGDGSFAGSLISPYTGSTKTYTVTTATKTAAHRYNGTGSGTGYLIDGVEAPFLTLTPGRTYRFTNDNTGSHPLKFYLEADKTTEYTTGVTFNNAYTEITVSDTTPQVLHYQCTNHAYMGNAVNTNTNKVQTPYSASVGAGSSVNGVDSPALTLSHNNPILTGTAGTTGQIKQIGGAPFYYDGSSWREFVLSSGTPVTVPADTDWDNVIYRNTFDSNFVDAKFNVNGTTGYGVTIAGSPFKVGGGSFRIPGNQVGAGVSYPNRSEYNFTGSWTIEGWFFLDSYTNNQDHIIVSMCRSQGASNDDWVFGYYTTSSGNIVFVWNNEHQTGATLLKTILNADVESDWKNKWRHIALVREGSDGSLHFYVDGVEDSFTANGNTTDNDIVNSNLHSLIIGGIPGSGGPTINNIIYNNGSTGDYSLDDLRITAGVGTAGQRYTSVGSTTAQVFTPSTVALPTTGTLSSNTNPPGDKYGEIVLGGSPSWVGTSGITVSQQSSGNYRLTFATSHTNSNDYFVLTQAMDQGFASYVGVARSTSHIDFSVNRESNDAAVDTGSLSVQIKNHS